MLRKFWHEKCDISMQVGFKSIGSKEERRILNVKSSKFSGSSPMCE